MSNTTMFWRFYMLPVTVKKSLWAAEGVWTSPWVCWHSSQWPSVDDHMTKGLFSLLVQSKHFWSLPTRHAIQGGWKHNRVVVSKTKNINPCQEKVMKMSGTVCMNGFPVYTQVGPRSRAPSTYPGQHLQGHGASAYSLNQCHAALIGGFQAVS